eukprot:203207-Chlamydomonas_euryale.AAC.8
MVAFPAHLTSQEPQEQEQSGKTGKKSQAHKLRKRSDSSAPASKRHMTEAGTQHRPLSVARKALQPDRAAGKKWKTLFKGLKISDGRLMQQPITGRPILCEAAMHRGQCIVVLRTFLRERKATSLLSTVLGRVSVSGIGGGGAAGLTASVAATAAITAFAAASAAAAVASDAAFECQAASCLPRSSSSHATSCLPPRTLQVLKAAVVHGRIVWQVGRARTDHGIARERAAARQQLPSSALKHGDDVVHACTRLGRVPLGCTARETNRLDRQAAGGVAAEADAQIGACAGERLVDAAAWRGVQGGAASAAAAAAAGRRSLVRKPVQADDANRERWRLRRGPAARRQPGSRRLQNIQLQREALRTGGGR